jgi:phosphate transport system permease protein
VTTSLFAPQHTMSAVIANEFTEAADNLYLSALVEIGLVLFVITIVINGISRFLIWRTGRVVVAEEKVQPEPIAAAGASA